MMMTNVSTPPRLGSFPMERGTQFRVWAPNAGQVDLVLEDGSAHPMATTDRVYFEVFVENAAAGTRYRYRLDGGDAFPDPASRFQPEGVHGPSEVVDPGAFKWNDHNWTPPAHEELVFYELHVGTFTVPGNFEGVTARLPYLRDLGVNAVELMPVADFPGRWNWGYDHAALYAPSRAYGRPDDLRRLVDEAHQRGLAVFLDVIYNHLGPDGAYLPVFGPIFTDKHQTPWGEAINLDDEGSRGVRDLFIDNALYWLEEFHIDGLRLDATHALADDSPTHFLAELAEHVAPLSPRRYLIAEDHRNLNTIVLPRPGGYGLDAIWSDDLHHQIRNITAGDTDGYYADFAETTAHEIAQTVQRGWFYDGRKSPSSGKQRGSSADPVKQWNAVVCIQNHDQVGNRPHGNRLTDEISLAEYRAATALLLFAPELPLLFQGQEWATATPFQFFTDHNPELGRMVSKGRKEEFKNFPSFDGNVPDPQDPATFERSRLDWEERGAPRHSCTIALYRRLLNLRQLLKGPAESEAVDETSLVITRGRHLLVVAFGPAEVALDAPCEVLLQTEDPAYAPDPQPVDIQNTHVSLPRAGAVWMRRL